MSRDGDSDPGPAVYKTAALPLSYLGKGDHHSIKVTHAQQPSRQTADIPFLPQIMYNRILVSDLELRVSDFFSGGKGIWQRKKASIVSQ